MLTVDRYTSWDPLESQGIEWNELAGRSPANEVFSTFEWLRAWTASKTREAVPEIIVLREGGRLAAIAPMMFSTKRIGGISFESLELIGTPNSDYSDFIYDDTRHLNAVWREVRRSAARADLMLLQQIKETSPTCDLLRRGGSLITRPCAAGLSAELPHDCSAPVSAYLKGPGLRERVLRRIEKEGVVALKCYESPAEIQANLPILFQHHVGRWAGSRTPSFFEKEAFRTLYRNWAEQVTPSTVLWVLTLNEVPVATLFGFVHCKKLAVHTVTYSSQHRQFRCGLVCIVKVMQTLRQRGVDYIDFTRGSEHFKSFFADIPTVAYEAWYLRSLRAKCWVKAYLAAKEFAIEHEFARRIARRFGYLTLPLPISGEGPGSSERSQDQPAAKAAAADGNGGEECKTPIPHVR